MLFLQQMCLQQIVKNFDIFHAIYTTTKNDTTSNVKWRLGFEVLRKRYSIQILKMLSFVHEQYVDFLLNKYLKILHTDWLNKCSWDVVIRKFTEIGSNIEELIIRGDGLSWEKVICHVPNVRTVIFKKNCNNNFLLSIAQFCPKIETLDIDCSGAISDEGVKHLCCSASGEVPCPVLKRLLIYGTGVGKDGIMHLIKKLPYIEEIDNFFLFRVLCSIHKKDVDVLDKVQPYRLTHINLRPIRNYSEISDGIKICISVCPHLKSFSSKVIEQEDLTLCSKISNLKELRLDCVRKPSLSIDNFLIQKGNNLTSLELNSFSVKYSVLVHNCPRLNSLTLDNITFQLDTHIFLPIFLHLKNISFKSMSMNNSLTTPAVTNILKSSPGLKHLSFIFCKMFPLDVKTQILKCCEQCSLVEINFTDSQAETELLQEILKASSSLKIMGVGGCFMNPYHPSVEALRNIACTLPNNPIIRFDEDY